MVRSDLRHLMFPDDDNILSCRVSTGHSCCLDTALHWADKPKTVVIFCLWIIGWEFKNIAGFS